MTTRSSRPRSVRAVDGVPDPLDLEVLQPAQRVLHQVGELPLVAALGRHVHQPLRQRHRVLGEVEAFHGAIQPADPRARWPASLALPA